MFKIITVVILVFFNVFAQLFLRKGMMNISTNTINYQTLIQIISSIHVWLGLSIYGVGFMLYLYVLSNFEVSFIFPIIMSAAFVLLLAFSVLFLNEAFTLKKILGILVISLGIFIISY